MALSGVEMALWDAMARLHGVSLLSLLVGVARPVPAYDAIGYDGAMDSAKVATDWCRRQFTGVKGEDRIFDGRGGPRRDPRDSQRGRAERRDHGGLQPVVDAHRYRRAAASPGGRRPNWIEGATWHTNYQGHAHIAGEIRTPIQCGKNWWGARDMQHAIEARASDYMMPDVMKIGGVIGWMRAAALGEVHGIRLSNHLCP